MGNIAESVAKAILAASVVLLPASLTRAQTETTSNPFSCKARRLDRDVACVAISSRGKGARDCLLVQGPTKISVSDGDRADFEFRVVNLLKEQVFVCVNGYEDLGLTMQGPRGNLAAGGSRFWSSDNTSLYKLLSGASCDSGKPKFTLQSVACVKGKLPLGDIEDLREWVGAKAQVQIVVSGFLRRNGKPFAATVKLPVTIVE